MSDLPQNQHVIASGIVAAVGAGVAYISFTAEPAAAFLFPRIISVVFVALSIWTFGKALLGVSRVGAGLDRTAFFNLLPGLLVALVYIFWAAKALGFYTATTLAFFILLSLYDPSPDTHLKTWGKRFLITGIFVAVMYGLFAELLNVFTPREVFF